MKKYFQQQNGVSLIEVLVGLTLMTLAISATVTIVFGSQSLIIDRDNTVSAELLAKEGITAAGALTQNDWTGTMDGTYGLTFNGTTWELSGTEDTSSIFTRAITIATTDFSEERKITSTVTWAASPLRPAKNVELISYVTDWANVLATGGDTSGGGTTGDWINPVSLASVDLGASVTATDVDVVGGVVYVSAQSSTTRPDIFAYNVNDPANPVFMSSLEVSADGLQTVDGNTGFVVAASNGTAPDLKVINNTNPASMSVASDLNVVSSGTIDSTRAFRDANIVYLGFKKSSSSSEFFAINVANQLSPSALGNFEINGDVNGLVEKDGVAYVASSNDNQELTILNVSNPSAITQIGTLNIPGTTDGTAVFAINPHRVFLAVGSTLYLIDAFNPANILTLATYNAGGVINDLHVAGTLAFLATSNSNKELQIVSIASTPVLWSSLNFPQDATGIDYLNNLIYISVRANDGLRIVTSASTP